MKPFFQLDNLINATFKCAAKLFGLEFSPLDIPLYHEDCRAWTVSRKGKSIAVFIGDYFSRPSKRSGAWCSAMRSQANFLMSKSQLLLTSVTFQDQTMLFCHLRMRELYFMNLVMRFTKFYPM